MYYRYKYSGQEVWLINHGLGDKLTAAHTDQLITSVISSDDDGAFVITYSIILLVYVYMYQYVSE